MQYVRLDDIVRAERNPKNHDADGISRMITHHGLGELPLRDDRTGRLVAGHGRLDQLTQMRDDDQDPPDGITVDHDGEWLVPVITGWSSRSDGDAQAYLIGSNQTTMTGGWYDQGLGEILRDLRAQDLTDVAGFTDHGVDAVLAGLASENPFDEGPTAGDAEMEEDTTEVFRVVVECRDEEQREDLLSKLTEEGYECRALQD